MVGEHRVPAGWDLARRSRPDHQVLSDAGFEVGRRREFTARHRWSLPELAGYIRSTSFLTAAILGDQADAFDADLAASLGPYHDGDALTETVSFALRPGPQAGLRPWCAAGRASRPIRNREARVTEPLLA